MKYKQYDYFNLGGHTWMVTAVSTFSGVHHYSCLCYLDGEDCVMGAMSSGHLPMFLVDAIATRSTLNDSMI